MIVDTKPYRCALEAVAPMAVCIHHAGHDSGIISGYVIAFGGIADQIVELWKLIFTTFQPPQLYDR